MSKSPTSRFRNFYRCPICYTEWQDEWNCTCDDECPHCHARNISPYKSEDLPPETPDTEGEKILKQIATKATEIFDTDKAVTELVKEANVLGINETALDDIVHDLCSNMASNVNNGGVEEQVKFIITQQGPEGVKTILKAFKESL